VEAGASKSTLRRCSMFPVLVSVAVPRFARCAVVLAISVCALVLGSSASAQGPTTLTFKELDEGSTFAFVDNAPTSKAKGEPSASIGDAIVFTNPLADVAGKRVGRLYVHCTAVVAAVQANKAAFACEGIMVVDGGTLFVQAFLPKAGATVRGTVTGGTGAYANARGTLVSRPTKAGADATITLIA
jgi:Allene oxide cyclase barrel like domain